MAGEIFISYRRADEKFARLLHERLKAEGVEAWYDAHVGAGEDWRTSTARALQNARIFVLLFSRAAAASDDITKELAAATFSKKLIVPVRIEDIQPEGAFLYELAGRNWIDAYHETEAKLGELARSLAALVKSGKEDPSMLPFDRSVGGAAKKKRAAKGGVNWTVLGVAAVAVAGIVAATWIAMKGPPEKAGGKPAAPAAQRIAFFGFDAVEGDAAGARLAAGVTDGVFEGVSIERLDTASRTETLSVPREQWFATAERLGALYVLSGSVRTEGETTITSIRLEDVPTRTVVWEDSASAARNYKPFLQARTVALAAATLRCITTYRAGLTQDDIETVRLIPRACADRTRTLQPNVDNWRRLVERAPDSPLIQWAFTSTMQVYRQNMPPATQKTLLGQATEARDRVVKTAGEAAAYSYLARYEVARWNGEPFVEQEKLLLQALAATPESGWANFWYSWLLLSVGRAEESLTYAQQALNDDPLLPAFQMQLGRAQAASGRRDLAAASLRRSLQGWPNQASWQYWLATAVFSGVGDVDEVLAMAPEEMNPAGVACWGALKGISVTSSQAQRETARQRLLTCSANSIEGLTPALQIVITVGLGDLSQPFTAGKSQGAALYGAGNSPTMFLPSMRPYLSHPEFVAVAENQRLMAYWKDSGTRPDFCGYASSPAYSPDAPICRLLGPATSGLMGLPDMKPPTTGAKPAPN